MKKYIIIGIVFTIGWFVISKAEHFFYGDAVVVVHPARGAAVQAVYATGTVEATVMMPISPRASARLMELNVDEGDSVTKGQILAQLEGEDVKQSINQLKAREEFAKKEFERNAILVKNNAASKKIYDQAKSDWEAAIAATKSAQAQLDYSKLIAPDNGLIIKRDGEVGQLIEAGMPLFWLSCCAPLRISAEIDEEDISLVKTGQEVLIRSDAFAGQVFHGKVKAITPKGDPVARSYRVRIEFTEETILKIGMTAETNIIISNKEDALLVPSSAVLQNKIWQVVDGKLVKKTVNVGARGAEKTEIDGVTENDFIVMKPKSEMKEGQEVRTSVVEFTTK